MPSTGTTRAAAVVIIVAVFAGLGLVALNASTGERAEEAQTEPQVAAKTQVAPTTAAAPTTAETTTTTAPTTTTEPPYLGWSDPRLSGQPWSANEETVEGLLTFRGNPTRSFYGRNVPENPVLAWTYEIGCANSPVGGQPKIWCGSGWTGQPAVFHPPGEPDAWWLAFGGYNRNVNFLDPDTGLEVSAPYATGDIIKGSITIDPDGFPLLYTGSRDNNFHVVALDRPEPTALWKLNADAVKPVKWNDDWDGSALIINDYLFEGGENSRFFIVKLNRDFDADGLVTVNPEIVFSAPSWDDELLASIGNNEVSIENSVAISENTVFFANSSGLIQGWDITNLKDGIEPVRTFRFWAGEDVDATLVVDDEGMLYAGVEYEVGRARAKELGQILKLDPSKPDDPLVWSRQANSGIKSGIWATPGLYEDIVIVATDDGEVIAIDRATGEDRWVLDLPGPLWQSPVIVDGVLIQGDCDGVLHGFDVSDTSTIPTELWAVQLEGCLESTPAVWDGGIYVGSRNGLFYALK